MEQSDRRNWESGKDKGVDMYSINSLNGVPEIQRDGRRVLSVWDQDWEFANEICELLNAFENDPEICLTADDRKWLKAMNSAFGRKVHHA